MSLIRSDEHRMLADSLRRMLEKENAFEARRQRLAAESPDRLALWPLLAELGAIGAVFDESCGGFGGDARSVAVLMFELGRSLAVEPFIGSAIVAGHLLQRLADAGQREAACDALIGGEAIPILAHDSGFDPFGEPLLRASRVGDSLQLSGTVRNVRHADVATEFLVSVLVDGQVEVLRVERDAVAIRSFRLMDGAGAGHLQFDDQIVAESTCLKFDAPTRDVLHEALDWGLLAMAAETAGILGMLNAATFTYLGTRKQFGVTIGSFQALQHRAADCYIAEQEVDAALELAIAAIESGDAAQRSAAVSAAKALADRLGRRVGHDAVQLHGGMGVSDELDVSHYARRLATMRAELGAADLHELRFGAEWPLSTLLGLQESEESRAWRRDARELVEQHLPESIRRKVEFGLKIEKEDYVAWQKLLYAHDRFAQAWPRAAGGQDWDLLKQLTYTQEYAVSGAPMVSPYGVKMLGPVIYTYGSDEQKRRHLPGILSSDVWWCQGYSEPGAGSDLASLKTFAERDGDHYVVNGAKMWTTEAHWADWMHCLVRTSRDGKPQAGISFLLIDMKTPGIEIKPVLTIDGLHHTNAVFLDNVRVPIANRVGEEGQGWSFAKFLLGNERISIADTGPKLRLLRQVQTAHRELIARADVPQAIQLQLTARLASVSMQLATLCTLERRYVEAWAAGKPFGAEASVLKIRGTEILQAIAELGLEVSGPLGAAHDPADLHADPSDDFDETRRASFAANEYLYSRCWSIFGGSNEVQRNLIAAQVLRG